MNRKFYFIYFLANNKKEKSVAEEAHKLKEEIIMPLKGETEQVTMAVW